MVDPLALSGMSFEFGGELMRRAVCVGFACLMASSIAVTQQSVRQATTAADAASSDTSYIDADGTARVTRVVPVPSTVSPEAQKSLSRQVSDAAKPEAPGCAPVVPVEDVVTIEPSQAVQEIFKEASL